MEENKILNRKVKIEYIPDYRNEKVITKMVDVNN